MAERPEGAWNPWRALRERTWLTLDWAELDGACGRILQRAGRRTIIIDPRLDRRGRAATLTHELVHDERGILLRRDTPLPLVAKEEAAVRDETARRHVPPDDLAAVIAQGEPVELWQLAERFDTTEEVARAAVERYFRRDPESTHTVHQP